MNKLACSQSNEWTGKHSFGNRSLHDVSGNIPNPYEIASSIIGRTLAPFDDDNLIPCYGFGDSAPHSLPCPAVSGHHHMAPSYANDRRLNLMDTCLPSPYVKSMHSRHRLHMLCTPSWIALACSVAATIKQCPSVHYQAWDISCPHPLQACHDFISSPVKRGCIDSPSNTGQLRQSIKSGRGQSQELQWAKRSDMGHGVLCAASTHDTGVFSFFKDDQPAHGLPEVVWRYRQIVPYVALSGPTSFAPLIHQAMRAVIASGMQYHICIIIADGQVRHDRSHSRCGCTT